MPKNNLKQAIPIFITLIGSTSVGKSYYLFSLGLAISNYPTLNKNWIISKISDEYKKQIKIWKQQHQEDGLVGATNLGENIQLSFTIENKKSKLKYEIILADMAGEEIVRYLNNESTYTRIANDIKMRIKLSSGILLMFDANKFSNEKEIDAWEKLLETGIFSSIDICLMKADLLKSVKGIFQSASKYAKEENELHPYLLYDKTLEDEAEDFFLNGSSKLANYMKNTDIDPRYHMISSLGVSQNNKTDEFASYNIFKPIIDILQNMENNFQKGLLAYFTASLKNIFWRSTLKKSEDVYAKKRYREAIEYFFNDDLISDTQKYHSILRERNFVLKKIHQKWIEDQQDYKKLSPKINIKCLSEKFQYYYREVIDDKELNVEINRYIQEIKQKIKTLIPTSDNISFLAFIEFLYSQWEDVTNITEHNSEKLKKVLKNLDECLIQLLYEQINILKGSFSDKIKNLNTLKLTARYISLYVSVWSKGNPTWSNIIKKEFGELDVLEKNIKNILIQIARLTEENHSYSIGFNILILTQGVTQKMKSLMSIPQKTFAKKNKEIAKLRLNFFESIPALHKMKSKQWLDDTFFETLNKEWIFWENHNFFPPPESLYKHFPANLKICPICQGKETVVEPCQCINGGWLFRNLHVSVKECSRCDGSGEIVIVCHHCDGSGKRNF